MFRPPPEYFWRSSKQKYEKQFRRKAPQWVLTLDRDLAKNLFGVCCRVGLKLHSQKPDDCVTWVGLVRGEIGRRACCDHKDK